MDKTMLCYIAHGLLFSSDRGEGMKRGAWILISVVAGGGLGWVALRSAVWSDVLEALTRLDWRIILLALGAVLFASFMEAFRWKLLLPHENVSTTRLFLVRNTGNGLNNISPIRVLSDVAQTTMLRYGDGVRIDKVVSSLIISHLFDVIVTMSLVGVGLIVLPQLAGLRPIVVPLWGLALVSLIAFVVLGRRMHRLSAVQRFSLLSTLLHSMNALTVRRSAVLGGILLTCISWMSIGVAAWLVAGAAGIDLPFWMMSILIVAVTLFTGITPAPPGAVGVYEFAVISTLGLFAVDPSVALNFALVIHGLLFLPSILIGIAVLAGDRNTVKRILSTASQLIYRRPHKAGINSDVSS